MEKIMATKKKTKAETVVVEENWPKVTKGSHLTVTEYANGKTELEWDDEALTRDVRNAILSFESRIPVSETKKVKNARTKKN